MTSFDTVFLIGSIVSVLLGVCLGCGKMLRILVDHFPGKILASLITYVLFGVVLSTGFAQQFTNKVIELVAGKDGFIGKVFLVLRLDLILLAVGLFLLVRLLLKLLAAVLASALEADVTVLRIVNRTAGLLLAFGFFMLLVLIAFQILNWVQGASEASVYAEMIQGSVFKLDRLYLNNPMNSVIDLVKKTVETLRA